MYFFAHTHGGTRACLVGGLLLFGCVTDTSVFANEAQDEKSQNRQRVIAPPADFYPYYLADPRSARTAIMLMGVDTDIPEAGSVRFNTSIGKRFGVVRFGDEQSFKAWQFDIEIGYFGQFDIENSLDSIGWDGVYGFFLSRKLSETLFVRVGNLHDSAHLGDEYIQDTGRERIRYTREEVLAGVAWLPTTRSMVYAEAGWAWDIKDEQKRLRLQGGAEYYGSADDLVWGLPWYSAVDVNLFEERDFEPAISGQLGLIYRTGRGTERYRFVLEAYTGRSPMGEFSFEDETYISIGVHYDH